MGNLARFDTSKVVKGSVQDIAEQTGQSLAEVFMGASKLVLVDTSSSMEQQDARGGTMSRHDAAAFELERVQNQHPGAVAVVSWSSDVLPCTSGVPIRQNGGTALTRALEYAKKYDGVLGMIVISDGEPDDEYGALALAKTFTSKLDTIYVGPEGGEGRSFLRQLAAACGGQGLDSASASDLSVQVERLMLAAG